MNKKLFWWLAFFVVAALSCWATASSFMMIIPLPWFVIWAMTIVFFGAASFAFTLFWDAARNDGSIEHPKMKLWAGLGLLLLTWVVISLPTNAHTFFYKLQIGNVLTEDLKTTENYTKQLAIEGLHHISKEDSAMYNNIEKNCRSKFAEFEKEAYGTGASGKRYIDKYCLEIISEMNKGLGDYSIPLPNKTQTDEATRIEIEKAHAKLDNNLLLFKKTLMADNRTTKEAYGHLEDIQKMRTAVDSLVQRGALSSRSAEPLIKQADGVLILAYANIKTNSRYVYFDNETDEKLYTAPNLETRTARFLHPYKVLGDFFSGKIPFIFIFWLVLSILLDVLGFVCFEQAMKKDMMF